VQGVPFFVFDRKFGISGAQPDEVFDQTLQQALQESN
jgi:predicted DsbA family dithiol-disulfide isomerase